MCRINQLISLNRAYYTTSVEKYNTHLYFEKEKISSAGGTLQKIGIHFERGKLMNKWLFTKKKEKRKKKIFNLLFFLTIHIVDTKVR